MQAESRRAARTQRSRAEVQRRHRRRARVWIAVGVLTIIVLSALTWLAIKALTVKNELEAAKSLIANLDDGLELDARLSLVGDHAVQAVRAANDPLWAAAESVPVAGENLRAVRLASEALDLIVNDIAMPVLSVKDDPSTASLLPAILPILETNAPALDRLATDMDTLLSATTLIGPVRSGIEQVGSVTTMAAPLVRALPSLLGVEAPKSYLLVFQNNAEALPLGGSAASQTLVSADSGNLAITAQASSASFTPGVPVDVAVDQSALDLYSSYLVDHVNTSTSRPDFPTAAKILRAFWNRDIDPTPIDGVVSIDPIALGRVLLATGPITVSNVEISSDNALQVLLSDAYEWWNPYASVAEAAASDAFFAGVAQTVFAKLSTGEFDLKDMAWAVSESIQRGNIMLWSEDPHVAGLTEGERLSGALPADDAEHATVGVFFRNTSASKIDFYMNSAVDVSQSCEAGTTSFTATATLNLDITQADADALPPYVKSGTAGSERFRTEVFVYGPVGTVATGLAADGVAVNPLRSDIRDLGRPVISFEMYIAPGATETVTATFSGDGEFGPLDVRTTPMIRETAVTTSARCGQ
ncbi:DUF4012 domain-containing protein [Microbacterium sp. NPDC058021]|uniref:DUF4012 domain-containing protein n=1 Tax=Microbacterium sp. NPDC058021 TaxID=3346306 RepID=UPI0036D87CA6